MGRRHKCADLGGCRTHSDRFPAARAQISQGGAVRAGDLAMSCPVRPRRRQWNERMGRMSRTGSEVDCGTHVDAVFAVACQDVSTRKRRASLQRSDRSAPTTQASTSGSAAGGLHLSARSRSSSHSEPGGTHARSTHVMTEKGKRTKPHGRTAIASRDDTTAGMNAVTAPDVPSARSRASQSRSLRTVREERPARRSSSLIKRAQCSSQRSRKCASGWSAYVYAALMLVTQGTATRDRRLRTTISTPSIGMSRVTSVK